MKSTFFQAIVLGVFGLAALIGIFVFATYTGGGSKGGGIGPVVLWGTVPAADMQAALAAVTQMDQAFKNVSYLYKDSSTLSGDLATAIATGNAPDLVLASQEDLHAIAKFIAPIPESTLSAAAFTDAFVREAALLTAPGGGYYGVPFLMDPLILFTNRATLASAGIARPPATWEALAGLASKVAVLTPSRQITRGLIALGGYANVHNARGILSTLFLQTGAPVSSRAPSGEIVANLGNAAASDTGLSPGQSVLGFYTQFADPLKVSYTWNASLPDSRQAFLAGDLALYLGYASEARFLAAANPNLDFGVAPVPQRATAVEKSAYGLLYAFMIPYGAKNVSGAYQAAALLTNAPEQAAAAAATGLTPVTLELLATAPAEPLPALAYAEALYARGWLSPAPADTDAVFSSMIGSVVSGRSPLAAALSVAESSLNLLLQK